MDSIPFYSISMLGDLIFQTLSIWIGVKSMAALIKDICGSGDKEGCEQIKNKHKSSWLSWKSLSEGRLVGTGWLKEAEEKGLEGS